MNIDQVQLEIVPSFPFIGTICRRTGSMYSLPFFHPAASLRHLQTGYIEISSLRTALFWFIVQRVVVIPYRRFGTTYRSHLQESRDGTERLSRNIGKELPLPDEQQPRRAQFSSTSWRKPKIAQIAACLNSGSKRRVCPRG